MEEALNSLSSDADVDTGYVAEVLHQQSTQELRDLQYLLSGGMLSADTRELLWGCGVRPSCIDLVEEVAITFRDEQ